MSIKNNLTTKAQALKKKSTRPELISEIIDSVISEKRYQYLTCKEIKIDWEQDRSSFGCFAKICPEEFKEVLSNIIDNAVEAIEKEGKIRVRLKESNRKDKITIMSLPMMSAYPMRRFPGGSSPMVVNPALWVNQLKRKMVQST